tara:strand:- start:5244 stop:5621 length:378 start_codon:yes stop_codon:yes gene_type:complete
MEYYPECPFKEGLECWNYNHDFCKHVDIEPYFGETVHKYCDKLNDAIIADKRRPMLYRPYGTLEEEIESSHEMAIQMYGRGLTENEIELIKEGRIEDFKEDYLDTGKVHKELLDYIAKKFEDESS